MEDKSGTRRKCHECKRLKPSCMNGGFAPVYTREASAFAGAFCMKSGHLWGTERCLKNGRTEKIRPQGCHGGAVVHHLSGRHGGERKALYTVAVKVRYECVCQGSLCIGYVFGTATMHQPVPLPRSPKSKYNKPSSSCTTTSSIRAATFCPTSLPTSSPSVNGNSSGAWMSLS